MASSPARIWAPLNPASFFPHSNFASAKLSGVGNCDDHLAPNSICIALKNLSNNNSLSLSSRLLSVELFNAESVEAVKSFCRCFTTVSMLLS